MTHPDHTNDDEGKTSFEEIPTGSIFNLGNTPSYPKLKTKSGYVDMRDEIVNNDPNQAVLSASITIMTTKDLMDQFKASEPEVSEWVSSLITKYI